MSKYDPLGHFLNSSRFNEVPMTFVEIERVLGFALPERSKKIRAWWSNNPDNSVLTKVWLAAGFRSEQVDMSSQKLVFRRSSSSASKSAATKSEAKNTQPRRHPGFGLMKGLTTIAPGTDLTAPTGGDWGRDE